MVTGGGSGIGYAAAQKLAALGAYVYIFGRRQAELEAAAQRLGPRVTAVTGDVTSSEDLTRLYSRVEADHRSLNTLIINSGRADFAKLEDIDEKHYDQTFDLNARAALFTVQRMIPLLRTESTIVLVGSVADTLGTIGYTAYNSSKAALRSFARTWTRELAPKGIRVNVVSPGPTETPMTAGAPKEVLEDLTKLIPLGRIAKAEEVAAAICFLASGDSSFIAGAELCVDGGMTQV